MICDAKNSDLLREAVTLRLHQPSFGGSGLFSQPHTEPSAGQTEAGDGIERRQRVLDRAWTAVAHPGRARAHGARGFGDHALFPTGKVYKLQMGPWYSRQISSRLREGPDLGRGSPSTPGRTDGSPHQTLPCTPGLGIPRLNETALILSHCILDWLVTQP